MKQTISFPTIEYKLIRSRRKTLSIEIRQNLQVIVRAPQRTSLAQIDRFVQEHSDWIETHIERVREQQKNLSQKAQIKITEQDIQRLTALAKDTIPPRVELYAKMMGVTYNRITIRHQRSRWGSCSSKGNLNFNCMLMLTPPDVQEYVIVHELCHRKQMNHSPAFWAEVANVLPDYRDSVQWLRKNGGAIIQSSFADTP